MRIKALILSVETQCTGLGQLNDYKKMLLPKVNKTSVYISTVNNTSMSNK